MLIPNVHQLNDFNFTYWSPNGQFLNSKLDFVTRAGFEPTSYNHTTLQLLATSLTLGLMPKTLLGISIIHSVLNKTIKLVE